MRRFTISILALAILLALAIPAMAAPPLQEGQASCAEDYTVQANDWLSKLADKFYGDVLAFPAIFAATNSMAQTDASYATIANADLIEPGWKLCIPSPEDAQMLAATDTTSAPTLNDMLNIVPIEQTRIFDVPFDVTPDPDANIFYFTASSPDGIGVFSVPALGGDTVALVVGAPFVAPKGIAINTDGQQLVVADPDAGNLFIMPISGGTPVALPGSAGTMPKGLEVINEGGADQVYFSGVDPSDGQPAVLKLSLTGSDAPTIIAKGEPLVEPGGIAITKAGVVYVADRAASGDGLGSVFKIEGSRIEAIASDFRAGDPVGATLTLDDAMLLVSAMHPTEQRAQVLAIELATGAQQIVTKVVGENAGSGGVHRAHNQNIFVWADSSIGPIGRPQSASSNPIHHISVSAQPQGF